MGQKRNEGFAKTFIAGAAIAAHRFVQFDGSDEDEVIQAASVNSKVIGVSDLGADAALDRIDIIMADIGLVEYGGTITITQGDDLTSDATGKAVVAVDALYQKSVAGGAAGDITVTGILTTDTLVSVLRLDIDATAANTDLDDLTSEFTITAANTINNVGGTASTGDKLMVTYQRRNRVAGKAMTSGVSGDIGSVLL
jgi:hypothetical protein